jgi:FkbM family methyltransferase
MKRFWIFEQLARFPKEKLKKILRQRVEYALGVSDGHFYVYDPSADLLSKISSFDHIGSLLAGRPVNLGYGDCDWFPFLNNVAYDNDIVFDVGGCRGYTSAWFSRRARHVFCFEPNPLNQESIREQMKIRGISNVELISCAVSDQEGPAVLHLKPRDGHHSLGDVGRTPTIGQITVETTTLDNFAAKRSVDHIGLLKVDVEGFESEVFLGAEGLLRRKAISAIVFEFSPEFYQQRKIRPDEPIQILNRFGYRVETLEGKIFGRGNNGASEQQDLIAYPQSSDAN